MVTEFTPQSKSAKNATSGGRSKSIRGSKDTAKQIADLTSNIEEQKVVLTRQNDLIQLGFLVIILTALGVVLAFFNLLLDFSTYKKESTIVNIPQQVPIGPSEINIHLTGKIDQASTSQFRFVNQ